MDGDKTVTAIFSGETPPSPPTYRHEVRWPRELTSADNRTKFTFSADPTNVIVGDHSVELGVFDLKNKQEGITIAFPIWERGDPDEPKWKEVTLQDIDASSISLKVKKDVLPHDWMTEGARSPCPLIWVQFSNWDVWWTNRGNIQAITPNNRYGPHFYFYPTDDQGSGPAVTVTPDDSTPGWYIVKPADPEYWKGFSTNGSDVYEFLTGEPGQTDLASWHNLIVSRDPFYWSRYKVQMGVGYGFVYPSGSTVYVDDLTIQIGSDNFAFDLEPGSGSAGGACFIATAAYGSYLDSHVETLQEFRDQYLVTNPVGSSLVSLYYKVSPPVAEFIDEHPALKPIVRVGLLPAVAMSTVAVNTTSAEKLAIVGGLALVSLVLVTWFRRRAGGVKGTGGET